MNEYTEAETVAEEWNMRCPKCGKDDRLIVDVITSVVLTPDGTDQSETCCGNEEWDGDSRCYCRHCDFNGTVKDFEIGGDE